MKPSKDIQTRLTLMIRDKTGLCLKKDAIGPLMEQVDIHMKAKGIDSDIQYLDYLNIHHEELIGLVNTITVNETYFYRETAYLDLLSQRLIPGILEKKRIGAPLKILSAGCSTGEEPYSIVMRLYENYQAWIDSGLISITGVDIDSEAIRKARIGIYRKASFRNLNVSLIDRYFNPVGNQCYQVKQRIRDVVSFNVCNLMHTPYPEELNGMDVIFYRNVSIYFETETREAVLRHLSDILLPEGIVVLSSTETLSHDFGMLKLVEIDGLFVFQKTGSQDETMGEKDHLEPGRKSRAWKHSAYLDGKSSVKKKASAVRGSPRVSTAHMEINADVSDKKKDVLEDTEQQLKEVIQFIDDKQWEPALHLIDHVLNQRSSLVEAMKLKAGILMNIQRMTDAKAECQAVLGKDPLCVEAYMILGLISRHEKNDSEAVRRFKKALYICSSCWPAHLYLADIYRNQGKRDAALREYGNVIRLIEKKCFSEHGLVFFSPAFSEEQVIRLCTHQISHLHGNAG